MRPVVIPGITIRGDRPKMLLIRAVAPALAAAPFNIPGTLANPVVNAFDARGDKIAVNDDWSEVPAAQALRAAMAAQGAFPLPEGSRDAALLVNLPPGGYTVQVSGGGTGEVTPGLAIVEVYEADAAPGVLVNLSCRAQVGTGGDILIGGLCYTAVIRPLESPMRSTPAAPIRSASVRNRLLIGCPPSLR